MQQPTQTLPCRFKHLRVNTKPQLHTAPGHPKAASSRTALGATLSKRPPSHKVAAKGTKGAPLTGLGDSYFGLESLDLAAQKPMDARGEGLHPWADEVVCAAVCLRACSCSLNRLYPAQRSCILPCRMRAVVYRCEWVLLPAHWCPTVWEWSGTFLACTNTCIGQNKKMGSSVVATTGVGTMAVIIF